MVLLSELTLAELRALARNLRIEDSFDKDALREACRIELARLQFASNAIARTP